tara:strand:- start:1073 stop:1519 length:447 start_codon:yes stop_codon:yes gene_type:complete
MDPVTAISAATAAFTTIKKGFELGREVESMYGDIGRWMTATQVIKDTHTSAKSKGKKYGSVEEEALETFGAMKKAKAMEDELRNWLIATHGMNAWNDLLRIQAKIRKARAEEIKRKKEEFELMLKWILGIMGFVIAAIIMIFIANKIW